MYQRLSALLVVFLIVMLQPLEALARRRRPLHNRRSGTDRVRAG